MLQRLVSAAVAMCVGSMLQAADNVQPYQAQTIQSEPARQIPIDRARTIEPLPGRTIQPAPRPAPSSSSRQLPADAAALRWEERDTTLRLPRDLAVDLLSGDHAQAQGDLTLVGFELLAPGGHIAQVDKATWEKGPSAVPAAAWARRATAARGSQLYFLRLADGRFARILLGLTSVDFDSAKSAHPGEIAQPTAFKTVDIRYWLSLPSDAKHESRLIPTKHEIDPKLVGRWKMARPAGAMIADVPGANNTILTKVGGWSAVEKGTLTIAADASYRWQGPDGKVLAEGRCRRIRPAAPVPGHTYWSVEGLGDDGFVTFDPQSTHETSDGLWAGNRTEPMAIGGKRLTSR